jgi:hypothetical protein
MKTRWRVLSGAIIILILFYILRKINFLEFYHILRTINPEFFILAFAAHTLCLIIFSLRGMIYVRDIFDPEFWFFLKTMLAGSFINVITPGAQVGGEPIKAYFLGKRYGKPKAKVFGALLSDRLTHGAISLFFIIASILFILTEIPVSRELKIIFQTTLFFIIAFLLLILFLNLKKKRFNLRNFLEKIRFLKIIKNKKKIRHLDEGIGNFTISFKKTLGDKKTLAFGILFSFVYWMLNYLSSYFLFLSLDMKISFFLVIVVVSLGNLVGDLSPVPGGIGLVEGFTIFLYSVVGINLSAAIIVSILNRMMGYFYDVVLGGISLVYLEKTIG